MVSDRGYKRFSRQISNSRAAWAGHLLPMGLISGGIRRRRNSALLSCTATAGLSARGTFSQFPFVGRRDVPYGLPVRVVVSCQAACAHCPRCFPPMTL